MFGTQWAVAKANYKQASTVLTNILGNIDNFLTTDYNMDDKEVGIGGWANFANQRMHLLVDVVRNQNPNQAITTIIHEASHLSSNTVKDKGYYGSTGFEAMSDDDKVTNAAHYEELPNRYLGISQYNNANFVQGQVARGGAITRDEKVRRQVSEYLRKAWDKAVNWSIILRDIHQEQNGGDHDGFNDMQNDILSYSRLTDMTIHIQTAAQRQVTLLDVTTAQSIARSIKLIRVTARTIAIPNNNYWIFDESRTKNDVINTLCTNANAFMGNQNRNRQLLDYLSN